MGLSLDRGNGKIGIMELKSYRGIVRSRVRGGY